VVEIDQTAYSGKQAFEPGRDIFLRVERRREFVERQPVKARVAFGEFAVGIKVTHRGDILAHRFIGYLGQALRHI
jgi:hypothetical protein